MTVPCQSVRAAATGLLLMVVTLCHRCAVASEGVRKGTTREAFLDGASWAVRKKLSAKDGSVWWWKDGPEWKDKYDDEWEVWLNEEEGPWGGSEKRGEWFSRMKDGYIVLGGAKVVSPVGGASERVDRVVHSFRIPSLVEVGGVLMGIGDARYLTSTDYFFTDTVARYSADGGKTWKTEVIIENGRVDPMYSRVVDPTVIAKGNSVYVLVARYNVTKGYWHNENNPAGIADWEPFIYKGVVSKDGARGTDGVQISWTKTALKSLYSFDVAGSEGTQFIGGAGNGVVTSKGTIVIPVQARNANNKVVSMIIYSTDNGAKWQFGMGETALNTSEASLAEWEGKLLMSTRTDTSGTDTEGGFRKVFQSDDLGATWEEALGTISRVIGNSPDRTQPKPRTNYPGSSGAFITATVRDVPVMLMTHPKNTRGAWSRDRLQLWLTDGNRMWLAGQIFEGDDNSAYSSLLFTRDGKLYCLHERNVDELYSLHLVYLVDELEKISATVEGWKAQDALLSTLCSPPVEGGDRDCTGVPTTGLVGLLAGPIHGGVWRDAYDCVNADVTNGVSVVEGVQVGGSSKSRVLWPVSEQGQDQRYYFSNTHFTLVATLRLVEGPRGEVSFMGFANTQGESNQTLKLSLSDGQWVLSYASAHKEAAAGPLKWNETHQIALVLKNGKVDAHVDGKVVIKALGVGASEALTLLNITHFFVGAPVSDDSLKHNDLIVSNVFLYNRVLDQSELQLLFSKREVIGAPAGDTDAVKGISAVGLCVLLISICLSVI